MLILCSGCQAKIRLPESAAGKRVKCPKCGTILRAPAAKKSEGPTVAESEAASVSTKRLPPPPPVDLEPSAEPEDEFTEEIPSKRSSGTKPPPIKPTRRAEPLDEDDDEPARRKRRGREDDDDEADEDIGRLARRKRAAQPVNNMAMTSMVMGIVALTFGAVGFCCCGVLSTPLTGICGILAIVFGLLGKSPGSEGYATTGIVCGAISLLFVLIGIMVAVLWVGLNVGMMR